MLGSDEISFWDDLFSGARAVSFREGSRSLNIQMVDMVLGDAWVSYYLGCIHSGARFYSSTPIGSIHPISTLVDFA